MKRITLFWLLLIAIGLLGLWQRSQREAFLRRGIPGGLPEPIVEGGLRLGVNVRLEQYDEAGLRAQLAAIAATPQIRYVKQPFFYRPDFDWESAENIVNAVAESGLTLVPLLDGNPADQFTPPEIVAFSQFAEQFATRFGTAIDDYIIWDEPNLSSHWGGEQVNPDRYAALLTAASNAIKAVDPNALISAAPLAPTVETDTINMADWLYLQRLYEADAQFDIAAGKPYGFQFPPTDRTVHNDVLNFSRIILLREVMVQNGDAETAIWAGNWGWNALPDDWAGDKSIWEAVTLAEQAAYTEAALARMQTEWPWMGVMFLENWEPNAPSHDPAWGFSIADRDVRNVQFWDDYPMTGFHFAEPDARGQTWVGDWTFSPQFGADSSEKYVENGDVRDSMTFTFWGTDVGMRVRRADFRARFYVTVDGEPANARPRDEHGTTVVLDAPNPNEDYITTELVASDLAAGVHTLEVVAHRGWDQFALQGFSVGYQPPVENAWITVALWGIVLLGIGGLMIEIGRNGWREDWSAWQRRFQQLATRVQLLIVSVTAGLLTLIGFGLWGAPALAFFRRLGDVPQAAIVMGTAAAFYITPLIFVYGVLIVALLFLISFRPIWGLTLITFSIPFYGREQLFLPLYGEVGILKPILDYRFSPTELFTLLTVTAVIIHFAVNRKWSVANSTLPTARQSLFSIHLDYAVLAIVAVATASLFFTDRLSVATNEWRLVIVEPALFYGLLRVLPLSRSDVWKLLDAFVLGGVVIAIYGLLQVIFGFDATITAEGGLQRVQSLYGSPNNVALYFGRILPILLALLIFQGEDRHESPNAGSDQLSPTRWWGYVAATILLSVTFLLTFSKGGLLIGMPAALFTLGMIWFRQRGRRVWPYVGATLLFGGLGLLLLLQVPALSARLNLLGETSFVRYRLWQASIMMVREHPIFGIGLDNFLYAHRGRYILESAWREPYLNHPHNIIFDFATRLGLLGLGVAIWLFGGFVQLQKRSLTKAAKPLTIGITAALVYLLAHSLVDHAFFLIDLSYSFFLLLGLALWTNEPY